MTQKRIEVGVFADGVIESTAQGKMMGVVSDPAMFIVNENVANELIGSVVYYIGETTVEEPIYKHNTYYRYEASGWVEEKAENVAQLQADLNTLTGRVDTHIANEENPHKVTKAQVGLGNVDDTSDKNKPISDATQSALDLKADASALDLKADASALSEHVLNKLNPHEVSKTQVGLGNVDNTSDKEKPISDATQEALNLKADTSSLTAHINDKDNPHTVTKAQIGLGSVEDGAQINIIESISVNTANVTPINKNVNITVPTDAQIKAIKVNNAANADVADVATNYNDAGGTKKTILSLDTRLTENESSTATANSTANTAKSSIDTHIANKENPHGVTKAQIGLGNTVDGAQVNVLEGIQIDGTNQTITNKKVNLITTSSSNPSDSAFALKGFVNSSINALAAFYITKDADGNPFSTHAELVGATTFYSGGEVRVPTRNDYAIVLKDEVNGGATHDSTRYTYNNGWEFQYIFNYQFTQAQIDALNSGITATKVSQIATNKSDIATINNSAVMKSGINSTKVATYDAYDDRITTAQNKADANANSIATINNSAVMKSGITSTKVATYDGYDKRITDAQNKANANETAISEIKSSAVMTSGITSAKVSAYDGYDSKITTNKNDISTINNSAVMKSGITSEKVATYDGYNTILSTCIKQGDTLSKPLTVTGGDQASAGKIILNQANKGQITDSSASTLFGFNDTTTLVVGSTGYATSLRGSGSRLTYNNNNIALSSDVNSVAERVTALENLLNGEY